MVESRLSDLITRAITILSLEQYRDLNISPAFFSLLSLALHISQMTLSIIVQFHDTEYMGYRAHGHRTIRKRITDAKQTNNQIDYMGKADHPAREEMNQNLSDANNKTKSNDKQ